MKVMLLAAGRGRRLRPLSDSVPKPLLTIGKETLIERHVTALRRSGFDEIVVNVSYLREKIMEKLGDGSRYGVRILWSDEGDTMLGTGGGVYGARTLLGDEPWLVINADVYTDWIPERLSLPDDTLAHLILVDNPRHCPDGNYRLHDDGRVSIDDHRLLTFSGIGCYRRALFDDPPGRVFQLTDVLEPAIRRGMVRGTHYTGSWADAGTIESLAELKRTSSCRAVHK